MTRYAFFVGCTIPNRVPFLESSLRETLPEFGIELADLPFGCCPDPVGMQSFDQIVWHTLAATNLTLAEEQNLDIIAACSGCFETLKVTNEKLKSDGKLRDEVNGHLSEIGREYKGTINVRHFFEVLYSDIGPKTIQKKVTAPLTGVKLTAHTGCHYLKPQQIMQTENPEKTHQLDEMIGAVGATALDYVNKNLCCGVGTRGVAPDTAVAISYKKLVEVRNVKADGLVTICPSCFTSYDIGQVLMNKLFNDKPNVPIFFYPELLGMAMGVDMTQGLKMHTTKLQKFLKK